MRVIYRDQLLASRPHFPLGGEQILRCGFVTDEWIGGNIAGPVDGLRPTGAGSTDEAAALVRSAFTRMRHNLPELFSRKLEV